MLEIRKLKQIARKLRSARANLQRGDTLVEVTIGIVIIGTILFSAYTVSLRAFKLGQSARERSQAAQLLQEQAEGLRSLRDSTSWNNFKSLFQGQGGSVALTGFHVEKTASNTWQLVNGTYQPGGTAANQNPDIATFYTLSIAGSLTGAALDKLEVSISITWPSISGNQAETSTIYLHLTDKNIDFSIENSILQPRYS